jgi:type I restriction enzyme S subunit
MIQGVVMNKFKRIKVYPLVSVQDVAKVHYGKSLKAEERVLSGLIPVFGSSGKIGTHDKTLVEYPTIIIGRKGSVGKVTYAEQGGWPIDTTVFYTEIIKPKKLNLRFFFYALKNSNLERWTITTSIPGINRDDIYKTKIPLPPIDEQRRIAAILDQADAIRRKRQKAIALTDELLHSTFLEMFGDPVINPMGWEVKKSEEITTKITDGVHSRPQYTKKGVPFISVKDITTGTLHFSDCKFITKEAHSKYIKRCNPLYNGQKRESRDYPSPYAF